MAFQSFKNICVLHALSQPCIQFEKKKNYFEYIIFKIALQKVKSCCCKRRVILRFGVWITFRKCFSDCCLWTFVMHSVMIFFIKFRMACKSMKSGLNNQKNQNSLEKNIFKIHSLLIGKSNLRVVYIFDCWPCLIGIIIVNDIWQWSLGNSFYARLKCLIVSFLYIPYISNLFQRYISTVSNLRQGHSWTHSLVKGCPL